jgi:hypothetical protein
VAIVMEVRLEYNIKMYVPNVIIEVGDIYWCGGVNWFQVAQ